MFLKLFLLLEIFLSAVSVRGIQSWQLWTAILLTIDIIRVLAVFTYAFDETRYSTTQFWGAFRFVYAATMVMTVYWYVSSLAVGFKYGIFPKVDTMYVVDTAIGAAALSFMAWAEWTVITRLSRGETARSFAAMTEN